jgi:hypothetical protein
MRPLGLIAIALVAFMRLRRRSTPLALLPLGRWKWLFLVIGAVCAVLVVFNPEYLALDLLGDAAFFDVFVLALTLQMYLLMSDGGHRAGHAIRDGLRCLTMPNTAIGTMIALLPFVIASTSNMVRNALAATGK